MATNADPKVDSCLNCTFEQWQDTSSSKFIRSNRPINSLERDEIFEKNFHAYKNRHLPALSCSFVSLTSIVYEVNILILYHKDGKCAMNPLQWWILAGTSPSFMMENHKVGCQYTQDIPDFWIHKTLPSCLSCMVNLLLTCISQFLGHLLW